MSKGIKLVIAGEKGKMAKAIKRLALKDPQKRFCNVYNFGRGISPWSALCYGDVVVDFTTPTASMIIVEAAMLMHKPLVIGTTGFSEYQQQQIVKASERIPILQSSNMSLGMNSLFALISLIALHFEPKETTIFEAHHAGKKDGPSGSAMTLHKLISEAVETIPGAKVNKPTFLRAGDVVGVHTIKFEGLHESLCIAHTAKSRDVFAVGALRAASLVVGQKPGLYSMRDVVGY